MAPTPLRILKSFDVVDDAMRSATLAVLDSRRYYLGPQNDAFEAEIAAYLGARHAIAVNSGTSGMFLVLKALGIGDGDDVVVPAMGFVTLAEAVVAAGARPVFVEVEPVTYNLDPDLLEAATTPRTKAVVPAHKYGHPAEMDAILEVARRRGLFVLEDACHALGAGYRGRKAGTLGGAGFTSFAGKSISVCGLGGMVTTDDDGLAEEVRLLRDHGRPRSKGERFYDIQRAGYNLRLSELHAAIGRVQLPHLDAWNDARRRNADTLSSLLADAAPSVSTPVTLDHVEHAFLHYTIRVPGGRRDALQRHLAALGIESSILYPQDLHLLAPYRERFGHAEGDFPVAEAATSEVLSLPNHPGLSATDLRDIAAGVGSFFAA